MEAARQRNRSIDTKSALLDAAERLFAERGLHGVSLREIGIAAGQRNQAAIQYHFGDKPGLVIAAFERRAVEVNRRRLDLLAEAMTRGPMSARDLVEAFVRAMAEQVERGNSYVRFVSRLQTDGESDLLRRTEADAHSAYERIGRLLRTRHLAALPRELFWNRWRLTINTALAALADHQAAMARGEPGELPTPVYVSELIDALTAMLLAPSTAAAERQMSSSRAQPL